jgi:hypothetical protein
LAYFGKPPGGAASPTTTRPPQKIVAKESRKGMLIGEKMVVVEGDGMPRITLEVFQSRLNCTHELLDSLALLSDETLRQINRTAIPAEIMSKYRKLIETMHTMAEDAAKLAESASKITEEDNALLQ